MNIHVSDYVLVDRRAEDLGCTKPVELTILPENFDSAGTRGDFLYRSEAATVRTLFRNYNLKTGELLPTGERPSYITNKNFEWTAPTLFIAASLLSENPTAVTIALGLITNYLTDFFKGIGGTHNVKMTFIVEKTQDKTSKKLEYKGPIEGISAVANAIKAISDE